MLKCIIVSIVPLFFWIPALLGQFSRGKIVSIPAVTQAVSIAEDFDGDQRTDLFLSGFDGQKFTHTIYRNVLGNFSTNNYSSVAIEGQVLSANIIDFDANGVQDLLITSILNGKSSIGLYENINGKLKRKQSVLDVFISDSTVAYPVDFNHDIYPDILMLSRIGKSSTATLFKNDNGSTFLDKNLNLGNNPMLSCAITRSKNSGQPIFTWSELVDLRPATSLYQIDVAGNLQKLMATLPAVIGTMQWVDIDRDNDEDLYILGRVDGKLSHGFLLNSNNDFSTQAYQLPLTRASTAIFHDFNADGITDISLSGKFPNDSTLVKVFTNSGQAFLGGKTLAVIDKANQMLGDFDQNMSSDLLIMGIDNLANYTLNSFSALVKSHPISLDIALSNSMSNNMMEITLKAPTGLPGTVYRYDYRLFKNNVLVTNITNPLTSKSASQNSNSFRLKLLQGSYKIELYALDPSGKVSNLQAMSFTVNSFNSENNFFEIVKLAGVNGIKFKQESKLADLNLDGRMDILALTEDSLCIPMLQNEKNHFVHQTSFPAEQLELSAIRAEHLHVYYLTKGDIKKYDVSKNTVTSTGITDVISFKVFDMDNDGDDDLICDSRRESRAVIYNFKDGAYQQSKINIQEYKYPFKIVDLNNDGYFDIITKHYIAQPHYKHINAVGYNIKGDSIHWKTFNSSGGEVLDIIDFDSDGDLDAFGYDPEQENCFIFKNISGEFSKAAYLAIGGKTRISEDVLMPKLYNLKKNMFANFFQDSIHIFNGDTDTKYDFEKAQNLEYPFNKTSNVTFTATADFNADKRLDIFLQYTTLEESYSLILYNKRDKVSSVEIPLKSTSLVKQTNVDLSWSKVNDVGGYYRLDLWTKDEKIVNAGIINKDKSYALSLPGLGDRYDTAVSLQNLPNNTYFWKVYAVQGELVSSPTESGTFNIKRYFEKEIISTNDTSPHDDFGGKEFSHPCDFDNDGDLDFLFLGAGRDTIAGSPMFISWNILYTNNGDGSFSKKRVAIDDLYTSDVAFLDYNKDGYQDIAITASGLLMANTHWETEVKFNQGRSNFFTKIYLNDKNNNFYDSKVKLPEVGMGNIDVADYDRDGDHDLLISGRAGLVEMGDEPRWYALLATYNSAMNQFDIDTLYKNSRYNLNSQFQDTDEDGDYDIFLLGKELGTNTVTQIIENLEASYFDLNKKLNRRLIEVKGRDFNYFDFGDFDRDGDMDMVVLSTNLSGFSPNDGARRYYVQASSVPMVNWDFQIYNNLGSNKFAPSAKIIDATVPKSRIHKLKWLDINNDGSLDIVLQQHNQIVSILQKTDGNFKVTQEVDIKESFSYSNFGDFNNDSRIDFIIGGRVTPFKCYFSNITSTNKAPQVPAGLSKKVIDNSVVLRWQNSTDDLTDSTSMKYAVELYNKNGLMYSNANYKTLPSEDYDNYCITNFRTFDNLPDGKYYWRVAAIDDNYRISEFSKPDTFKIALRPVILGKDSVCNYETSTFAVFPKPGLPSETRYLWEVDSVKFPPQSASNDKLVIPWKRHGKHSIKVTNTFYKFDTTFVVYVKPNPYPKIDYLFVEDSTGNRTLQFKDSLRSDLVKTHYWTFGDGKNRIDSTDNPRYTFDQPGTYQITLTMVYKSGCQNSYTRRVDLQNPLITGKRMVCKGDTSRYLVAPKNFRYEWTAQNGTILNKDSSTTLINVVWNETGLGSLMARNGTLGLSDTLNVLVNSKPTATITIPDQLGTNSQIKFKDSVSADVVKYDWNFGEINKKYEISSPTVVFEQSGPHTISFTATNNSGCDVNIKQTVQVTENLVPITIANLITQNNDGFNDLLKIENIERFPDSEVKLYSPWGSLIYEKIGYQNDWKPGSNGVEILPSGSYLCVVNIPSMNKKFQQIITVLP